MKNILIFILVIITIIGLNAVEDVSIDTFFSEEEKSQVLSGEIISRMYVAYNAKKENTDEFIEIKRTKYNDEDFSIYEVLTDEKFFIQYDLETKSKLDLYNVLTAYSKLEGMVYYSRRARKHELLIKKSHRVRSISENREIDITYNEISPKISVLFLQKDNKLGTLYFRNELYNEADDFVMINSCIIPITKAIFTINDKEEYKIYSFFLYDKEQKGYFCYTYQVLRVKLDGLLKTGVIAPTTFSNRLRASTVHFAKLIGLDWSDKLNPWKGIYDRY